MKYFIANWKMNGSQESLELYCKHILDNDKFDSSKFILSVPAILTSTAYHILNKTDISLSAQCVSEHNHGAHTGQLSADMFSNFGCSYALVGHSERRKFESIESTCNQVKQCLTNNLKPIVCIGETLDEKQSSRTKDVLLAQLKPILDMIDEPSDVWIAYEPRWAIGSGLTPGNKEINMITHWVKELIDTKLIYGGSVNPDNIKTLTECDVDGFLVGGASLDHNSTNQMVNICTHYS